MISDTSADEGVGKTALASNDKQYSPTSQKSQLENSDQQKYVMRKQQHGSKLATEYSPSIAIICWLVLRGQAPRANKTKDTAACIPRWIRGDNRKSGPQRNDGPHRRTFAALPLDVENRKQTSDWLPIQCKENAVNRHCPCNQCMKHTSR